MITKEELAEGLNLATEATPGPWLYVHGEVVREESRDEGEFNTAACLIFFRLIDLLFLFSEYLLSKIVKLIYWLITRITNLSKISS